jgi:hypothetical protein
MVRWTDSGDARWIAAGAIVFGFLVLLGGWGLWSWLAQAAVPVPPATASARQVVLTFIRALNAHDATTAEALWVPDMAAAAQAWTRSTTSITDVKVRDGGPPLADGGCSRDWVFVRFRYVGRSPANASFRDGVHVWGYDLTRSHGRLLICDQGLG